MDTWSMFDDLAAYYHENVVSSYVAYREISKDGVAGRSRDLREALTAANALFHLREHLPNGAPYRGQVEQLCHDYALLGDVVNTSRHKSLTGNTPHGAPLVNDAASLGEQILLIEYEDGDGIYRYTAKTVVVNLINGTERNLLDVLTNVINFWEQHMASLGIISEARTFNYDDPVRARTRAECEESRLDFELVQGHRFRQSMRMLRFNNDTGQAEPIDLTGSEIKFRIYRPKFDIDISLTHDATGMEFKKTITLSESDSLELSKLSSDAEKQAYVNALPEAQDALRQLAISAKKYYKGKCQMVVKFSRHAKRRAKLYKIPESTVEKILVDSDLSDGDHEVIRNVSGFKYPIKIVVSVESNVMTVITNYPLKKGRSQ